MYEKGNQKSTCSIRDCNACCFNYLCSINVRRYKTWPARLDENERYPFVCDSFYSSCIGATAKSKETYGALILSKNTNVKILNISNQAYICNYPINLIKYTTPNLMTIYLAHAPPPVPKCGYQTSFYIKGLSDLVAKTDNETNSIIIGDFNTLPFQNSLSSIFRLGYQDSHFAINKSHGGTFSPLSWFPKIFKIDYIFNKSGFQPETINYFELKSSDHKGFIADFSITTKSQIKNKS